MRRLGNFRLARKLGLDLVLEPFGESRSIERGTFIFFPGIVSVEEGLGHSSKAQNPSRLKT